MSNCKENLYYVDFDTQIFVCIDNLIIIMCFEFPRLGVGDL